MGENDIFLLSLSGQNNSLRCLWSRFSQLGFYLALRFGQRKGGGWRVWGHVDRWRDEAGRAREELWEQNQEEEGGGLGKFTGGQEERGNQEEKEGKGW